MIILLHVLIAVSSIIYSGYSFFSPSRTKLHVSYGLIALTLASGTYLVISTHSSMLTACTAGLVYLGVVITETFAVRSRLAKVPTE